MQPAVTVENVTTTLDAPLARSTESIIESIVNAVMILASELVEHPLYDYQEEVGRRFVECVVGTEAEELTLLASRQCLDKDTVIYRRDGTAVRISEHEDAWCTGVKSTKRYKMRGGAEITATDNHPLWTPHGWVPAGSLRVGDQVAVLSQWERWGLGLPYERTYLRSKWKIPHTVRIEPSVDMARFFGYFTTDGSFRPKQSPKFTNITPQYLDEMDRLADKLFGITAKWYKKGKGFDLLFTATKSSFDNKLTECLYAMDWDHGFPLDVFSWNREQVGQFVATAWAGDGCVGVKGERTADVSLACGLDEVYARYWQALLAKAGITSTVKREWMSKSTGWFHRLMLGCGEQNIQRFLALVGDVPGKERGCDAIRTHFKNGAEFYDRIVSEVGTDGEELTWAPIISIVDMGEREVWDVTYPDKGWFIAQNVKVHNSGKTEAVSACIASMMILLPRLAPAYPELLGQFKTGLMVGVFAPVEDQADTMFKRVVGALTTETALEVLSDDEIDDIVGKDGTKTIVLKKCRSFCRSQTAHRAASIESKTYHVIIIDECQSGDDHVITKSIHPMLTSKAGTILKTGSASRTKGNFYTAIQRNKSRQLLRGAKKYHFEYNWRYCAKSNPLYLKAIEKEKERLGEDSEDFLLSYECKWLLDRGMFISESVFEALSDKTMDIVPRYHSSRLVAGLDVARKRDSTVLTVMWADFDHPDPATGLIDCRVLNWLEIPGDPGGKWHSRYNQIADFLENYSVMTVGVDGQGMGDVVREDLEAMLPHIEWRGLSSDTKDQSDRWKHLSNLMGHGFIGWPGKPGAKRTKIWQRFKNEMENLEKVYKGKYLLAAAPEQEGAHDDFADSLSLATWLPKEEAMPQMQVMADNPFFRPRPRYR